MGNSSYSGHTFNKDQWVQATNNNSLFPNVNPFRTRILMNISTGDVIEEYIIRFVGDQDYRDYIRDLQWRSSLALTSQLKHVYPIQYFLDTSENQFCTVVYSGLVYARKVEVRVKDINDIPYTDSVYIYSATLDGFRALYQKFGAFQVDQDMVFIDDKGKIKVWMNPNLSKNYPLEGSPTSLPEKEKESPSQSEMVSNIITILQDNIDPLTITSPLFSDYLSGKSLFHRLSFNKAFEQLENFKSMSNLPDSDCMTSIADLYDDDLQTIGKESKNKQQKSVRRSLNSCRRSIARSVVSEDYNPLQDSQSVREVRPAKKPCSLNQHQRPAFYNNGSHQAHLKELDNNSNVIQEFNKNRNANSRSSTYLNIDNADAHSVRSKAINPKVDIKNVNSRKIGSTALHHINKESSLMMQSNQQATGLQQRGSTETAKFFISEPVVNQRPILYNKIINNFGSPLDSTIKKNSCSINTSPILVTSSLQRNLIPKKQSQKVVFDYSLPETLRNRTKVTIQRCNYLIDNNAHMMTQNFQRTRERSQNLHLERLRNNQYGFGRHFLPERQFPKERQMREHTLTFSMYRGLPVRSDQPIYMDRTVSPNLELRKEINKPPENMFLSQSNRKTDIIKNNINTNYNGQRKTTRQEERNFVASISLQQTNARNMESSSKLQYFTTQTTYELDPEIAKDLQEFMVQSQRVQTMQ